MMKHNWVVPTLRVHTFETIEFLRRNGFAYALVRLTSIKKSKATLLYQNGRSAEKAQTAG